MSLAGAVRTAAVTIRLDAVAGTVVVAAYRDAFAAAAPLAIERLPILPGAAPELGTQLLDYPSAAPAPDAYAQLAGREELAEALARVGDAALAAVDA